MLLAVVLLFGLFSGQVLAAAQEESGLLAAKQTEISLLGANMSIALWKKQDCLPHMPTALRIIL